MFADKFSKYDKCAPAGVLLPKIKIDKRFYNKLKPVSYTHLTLPTIYSV